MARYPAAAAAPVALLAVLAAATPARAVLAGRPAAIRRGHGGPLCGVRAVGAAAAVLLAVAFAAPASAAPCTPLQLEQFKERYPRGTAPPCAASKLAAVPAACADWAPGAAAPPVAPGATWALANFGTCKASAAAGCAGACATVDGWCLGPYLPTVPGPTFEESTLAGEDSAAGAYCCCPGNPSCQRATAGACARAALMLRGRMRACARAWSWSPPTATLRARASCAPLTAPAHPQQPLDPCPTPLPLPTRPRPRPPQARRSSPSRQRTTPRALSSRTSQTWPTWLSPSSPRPRPSAPPSPPPTAASRRR